jgi:hypothetical protein
VQAALVTSSSATLLHRGAWEHPELDLSAATRYATHAIRKHRFRGDEVASDVVTLATLDYRTLQTTDMRASATFAPLQPAAVDGIALWFDAILSPGVTFSSAPTAPELVYGQLFLPFEESVWLEQSDLLSVALTAKLFENDQMYVWRWRTSKSRHGTATKLFDQSSVFAMMELPAATRKAAR